MIDIHARIHIYIERLSFIQSNVRSNARALLFPMRKEKHEIIFFFVIEICTKKSIWTLNMFQVLTVI